jgi:SAM-dependent methyltransferase
MAPSGPFWVWKMSPNTRVKFAKLTGPFCYQANSSTRKFEYPWAFYAVPLKSGMTAVEIGGGLSGLQFVINKTGVHFTNVDPFLDYGAEDRYLADAVSYFHKLNKAFGTTVALKKACLWESNIETESIDVAYMVSVIEHLSPESRKRTLETLYRLLKPGGFVVATTDLFLNLQPFSNRRENQWGTNVSIQEIVDESNMELIYGDPSELYGFSGFSADSVLSTLEEYLINEYYPQLAQAFVLRK